MVFPLASLPFDGYLSRVVGFLPGTPPQPITVIDPMNPIPDDVKNAQICVENSFNKNKTVLIGLDDFKKCLVNDDMAFSETVTGTPQFSYGSLVLDPAGDFTARVGVELKFQSNYTIKYTYTPAADIPDYSPAYPGCVALSAEVLAFLGKVNAESNFLEWTSLQNEEFSHFELERSSNMQNWENIAHIERKNGSPAQYYYEDNDIQKELYYYRLKMVDKYDNFSYSDNILSLHNRSILNSLDVHIYPNPAQNILNLQMPGTELYQISIKDLRGKTIWEGKRKTEEAINISNLKTGVYLLELSRKDKIISKKFIKK